MKILSAGLLLFAALPPCVLHAQSAEYSPSSGELDIPYLHVGGDSAYAVKMTITDPDALEFAVSDLVKLPPFAARFDLIQNEESRGQVLARLGLPDAVSNLGVEELPRCDEPLLEPGTPYEQWEYGVDSNAQGPTGFVVWFAATTDPRHWRTVGKVEGYSCL